MRRELAVEPIVVLAVGLVLARDRPRPVQELFVATRRSCGVAELLLQGKDTLLESALLAPDGNLRGLQLLTQMDGRRTTLGRAEPRPHVRLQAMARRRRTTRWSSTKERHLATRRARCSRSPRSSRQRSGGPRSATPLVASPSRAGAIARSRRCRHLPRTLHRRSHARRQPCVTE